MLDILAKVLVLLLELSLQIIEFSLQEQDTIGVVLLNFLILFPLFFAFREYPVESVSSIIQLLLQRSGGEYFLVFFFLVDHRFPLTCLHYFLVLLVDAAVVGFVFLQLRL